MQRERGGSTWVEGFRRVRRGFETEVCSLQIFQEGLGPLVEEVVRWLIKPPAAVPVPVGLEAEGVTTGALVEEVMEGVGGPAALAGKLVLGNVWTKTMGVVGRERVAHGQAKGGGGVPGVDRQGFASFRVRVHPYSLLPKRMVVAGGGFGDRVFVDKGGVGTGAGGDGPLCGPPGDRALTGKGLAVRSRLDPIEGGTGGDAASHKGFVAGRRVCGAVENGRGPDRCEMHRRVASDEGGEGGVEEERLTLVSKAPGVGDRGKSR